MITGRQIREARLLAKMTQLALAARTRLNLNTIRRAESVDGESPITIAQATTIRRALEAAGVEFIGENGEAPVRFKRDMPS